MMTSSTSRESMEAGCVRDTDVLIYEGTESDDGTGEFDVEEILEMIPIGWFHYRLLLICGCAFMADAMEISLLAYLSICAGDDWNLSSEQVASISSSVFGGMLVGNVFWGPVADSLGRRRGFIVGSSIITVCGIATGFAPNYATLLVIRTCLGFGVGGSFISFDILAELLPRSTRGQFLTNINYFWTLGSLLVSGLAWALLGSHGWHLLAVLTSLPVAVSLVWAIVVMPESPRWLALKGRYDEAEAVLLAAAICNGSSLPPFSLRRQQRFAAGEDGGSSGDRKEDGGSSSVSSAYSSGQKEESRGQKMVNIGDFFSGEMRPISLPLFSVWFLFGWTYYGIIFLVARIYSKDSDDDVDDSDFTCDFEYGDIFYNAASEVVGVALTALVIDRFGRNTSQTALYLCSGLFFSLMGVGMPAWALSGVGFCARIGSMAATSVTMVVTPELFPTRLRATGHALCSSCQRVGGFAAPFLVTSSVSVWLVGLLFAAGNWAAAACSYALPETKGRGLDTFALLPGERCSMSEEVGDSKKPLLAGTQ